MESSWLKEINREDLTDRNIENFYSFCDIQILMYFFEIEPIILYFFEIFPQKY